MEKCQLRVFIRRFDFTLEMFFIIKNKETALSEFQFFTYTSDWYGWMMLQRLEGSHELPNT